MKYSILIVCSVAEQVAQQSLDDLDCLEECEYEHGNKDEFAQKFKLKYSNLLKMVMLQYRHCLHVQHSSLCRSI